MFCLWHSCPIPALFRISFPLPVPRSCGLAGFRKMFFWIQRKLRTQEETRPVFSETVERPEEQDRFISPSVFVWNHSASVGSHVYSIYMIFRRCSSRVLLHDSDECSRFCCVWTRVMHVVVVDLLFDLWGFDVFWDATWKMFRSEQSTMIPVCVCVCDFRVIMMIVLHVLYFILLLTW